MAKNKPGNLRSLDYFSDLVEPEIFNVSCQNSVVKPNLKRDESFQMRKKNLEQKRSKKSSGSMSKSFAQSDFNFFVAENLHFVLIADEKVFDNLLWMKEMLMPTFSWRVSSLQSHCSDFHLLNFLLRLFLYFLFSFKMFASKVYLSLCNARSFLHHFHRWLHCFSFKFS